MKTHRWFLLASVALLFSSCSGSDLNPSRPTTDDTSGIYLDKVDVHVEYKSAQVFGTITVYQKPERISKVEVLFGDSASQLSRKATGSYNSQDGFSVNLTNLEDGAQYFYRVDIIVGKSSIKGEVNNFITFPCGPVDLDLPSGKKWASANLGAELPTDSGDHYAWGETSTKPRYDWATYKYCNGEYNKLTKYCTNKYCSDNPNKIDNLIKLSPEDDAATAILGQSYATPSSDDWKELKNNCKIKYTTINGVTGLIVSSFKDSNNYKKFIFLSGDTGYYDGTHLSGGGYYWSSTLDSQSPWQALNAWMLTDVTDSAGSRSYGEVIRPIYVK